MPLSARSAALFVMQTFPSGLGDDGVMAFTDFGIETLVDLIKIYKADPELLKR
jgi:hypothetical protein